MRDSITASNLWKNNHDTDSGTTSHTLSLAKDVERKQCRSNPSNYEPTFDKLILIVIDAFGSEFIPIIDNALLESEPVDTMPFIMSSIRERSAMGFVAKAATPTVTMPRVKALLSGTIPSFVDIVYNLASDVSKFDDDNIIRIAKKQNKKLVFYGDDTWLSLFDRDIFARSKETFSFFANDYTTVDTNVTERALPETSAENIDWDFLLLHYLGLDHIGHVFGTNENSLISDKLGEMDTVIKQIHDNMLKKPPKTLVVICGDHGMSKEGNHGGGSDLEANTAMLFLPIGLKLDHSLENLNVAHPHIKQVDLAATLSSVLGFDIPKISKGVVVKPFLERLWAKEKMGESKLACALLSNFIQIADLQVDPDKMQPLMADQRLNQALQDHLAARGNLSDIALTYHSVSKEIQNILLDTIASRSYPLLTTFLLILATALTLFALRKTIMKLLIPTMSQLERYTGALIVILPILFQGSTDFLEFEHKFWPLFSVASCAACFAILGTQRGWDKTIRGLDPVRGVIFTMTVLVTSLRPFSASATNYLWSIASMIMLCNFIRQNSDLKKFRGPLAVLVGLTIMYTKHIEESLSTNDKPEDVAHCALMQKLALLIVIIMSVLESIALRGSGSVALVMRKLTTGWICMGFLLSRQRDFLFLITNLMMETSLNSICKSIQVPLLMRSILYFNFAQAAFFNQGNSNSLSSIDVKPAFFGQMSFNLYLSIPLVALATYSTQIYWLLKLFQRAQEEKPASVISIRDSIVMRNFLAHSYYMFVCMWLRNHLFIWSVLSPKLLYVYVTNIITATMVILVSSLSHLQVDELPLLKN